MDGSTCCAAQVAFGMTGLVGSAVSNMWHMVRLMSASAWMCLFISPRYACSLASQPPRPESRSALSLGYLSISVLACIQRPSHRWVCVAPTLSVRRLYTFLFIDSCHPTAKAAHLACEAATDLLGPVASRVRRPFFWPPSPDLVVLLSLAVRVPNDRRGALLSAEHPFLPCSATDSSIAVADLPLETTFSSP